MSVNRLISFIWYRAKSLSYAARQIASWSFVKCRLGSLNAFFQRTVQLVTEKCWQVLRLPVAKMLEHDAANGHFALADYILFGHLIHSIIFHWHLTEILNLICLGSVGQGTLNWQHCVILLRHAIEELKHWILPIISHLRIQNTSTSNTLINI